VAIKYTTRDVEVVVVFASEIEAIKANARAVEQFGYLIRVVGGFIASTRAAKGSKAPMMTLEDVGILARVSKEVGGLTRASKGVNSTAKESILLQRINYKEEQKELALSHVELLPILTSYLGKPTQFGSIILLILMLKEITLIFGFFMHV
jgi:hypothetical protein